jgi:hypothetical protein
MMAWPEVQICESPSNDAPSKSKRPSEEQLKPKELGYDSSSKTPAWQE